ncbi:MAG: HNH endonuclease signature motif containing protein [Nanoarchaeota archaeon]
MSRYRQKAFKYLSKACAICGYDTEEVLEVHHKDGNRKNNNIDNLEILCPTHHKEKDLQIELGRCSPTR